MDMMDRKNYNELMAKIADGGKVNRETYDELLEFAKARKTKRPSEDAILDGAAIKEAATTAKGTPAEKPAKAKKEPKAKAKCSVTKGEGKGQDPKMSTKKCPEDARAGGMCATHYSRLIYRAIPENAEKARQASRNYAAKVREQKKAEKAKAEASAA